MSKFLRIAVAALAIAVAAPASRAAMDDTQKKEIEGIIHDYLLANPEVLEEAFRILQDRKQQAEAEKVAQAIGEKGELINNSEHQMVLGNPEGAITVVEFFDYNCGYCKRAVPDMLALIEGNPDLRVVLKEFPILSPGSIEAARIAVAIKDIAPDKYLAFHQELFARPGPADATKSLEIVADLGLDAEAVKTAAASNEVSANITEVRELAESLGITGTPSYVIGKEIVPGALGYDALQQKVTAMRECGVTVC